VNIVIGYQSKTIDTVNAGTLLRAQGTFEANLAALGRQDGHHYLVTWEDYDNGSPITAQMLAGKLDIGSMGDFPLVINAARTAPYADARSELVAITAFNPQGGLNGIVGRTPARASTLLELKGQTISTSVGSAGDGLLQQALHAAQLPPTDFRIENQGPSVGASALKAGSAQAVSQFAPWPGLLAENGDGELIVDGATARNPTFHGVVARKAFASQHPGVMRAFLAAVVTTTNYLNAQPIPAARTVARITGLPLSVVYLYNGPTGIATFDPSIQPALVTALRTDSRLLRAVDPTIDPNIGNFVNAAYLRGVSRLTRISPSNVARTGLRARINDCSLRTWSASSASEVWFRGAERTSFLATPECALRYIRTTRRPVEAAYVPDTLTGTRWFAERSVWLADPAAVTDRRILPFCTKDNALHYLHDHPGSTLITYQEAMDRA